jgi:elongation factor G
LTDGSYHDVDSSDMAFQLAGRLAMSEAMPQCQPVLLEPINTVEIVCPSDATAKINAILSQRRGQIVGFDAREDWPGWDVVKAMLPESEIGDLIIEIRSATAGVGGLSFQVRSLAGTHGQTGRSGRRRAQGGGIAGKKAGQRAQGARAIAVRQRRGLEESRADIILFRFRA